MLAMKRKEGETIVVDGPAVITIHEVHATYVRVAVEAPRSTGIWRGEVYAKILAQQSASEMAAAAANPIPLMEEMTR